MNTRTLQMGETLFEEGAQGHQAFIVRSGQIKIVKKDKDGIPFTLTTLGKGEVVGEMALIDEAPRAAGAVATDITEVLIITKEDFTKRLEKCDQVVGLLLKTFTRRLREQSSR